MISYHIITNGELGPEQQGDLPDPSSFSGDDRWLWVDVVGPTQEDFALLEEHLGLHPLAVEDAGEISHRPKAAFFENHSFLSLIVPVIEDESVVEEVEGHILLSESWFLTIRFTQELSLHDAISAWLSRSDIEMRGPNAALYAIADHIAERYLTITRDLLELADLLEDETATKPFDVDGGSRGREQLLRLRRTSVHLRRTSLASAHALNRFGDHGLVSDAARPYFTDVADNFEQAAEQADGLNSTLSTTLDILSAQSDNHLNIVMRSLTAWASVLLISTFLTGYFGMNFPHMFFFEWRYGLPLALVLIFGIPVVTWYSFKKRGWV